MLSVPKPLYNAPFDAVAEDYDELFTTSRIGQAQRVSVWTELKKTFRSGDRVLEIGCGTGVDACFLGSRGVRVMACDSSPRMVAVATRRVRETGNSEFVQPYCLPAEELSQLREERTFDGAFSNFGALNCIRDLRRLASDLSQVLHPGASVLLCLMGPCCLWELIWYLAHGKPRKAFRRFHREGVDARLADGAVVRVFYPSVRSLTRTFAPEFLLKSVKGIGVSVPPSYLEPLALRYPRVFALQKQIDSLLGECPGIRLLADHILLRFERTACA
ncbi:MAG: methyltransferase domain-containing protein [Candidatus Sulfotelmatobacter sp.]